MRLAKISILSIFVGLSGCVASTPDHTKAKPKQGADGTGCAALVNGKKTSRYPAVGLVASIAGGEVVGTCTATWVGKTTLLTASHCTVNEDPRTIAFIPGND